MQNTLSVIAAAARERVLALMQAPSEATAQQLFLSFRPSKEDYHALFDAESADLLYAVYESQLWAEADPSMMQFSSEYEDVFVFGSSTKGLRENEAERYHFPGGYTDILEFFSPKDYPIFLFNLVAKGETSGMNHNGLYCMNPDAADGNYRFIWIPKPWRVLR